MIFESVDSNLEQQIAVKQMSAIGFANAAYADLRSMQAITTADSDLERIEIDQAMSSMKNFVREMFKSISADHSHQWTDIYYQELLRAIYVLEGLFGVVAISETERKEYLD
ncbi:hypothetical protein IV56_GL000345 [Lacticaseibacillus saniviri JCM 17471 = DSM 24301]|uniref:Uncharacterized protein n=1 Tax=Lacticaseibacillus saniviri JCM 17471 = DSM 24301 TaxID=1293598 RepID=A0A0R2N2S3_9LACO|nr:hypothetical protein IV56_GL000345 [Lacticaseibacillus saniviri JCM 17471 = DSM 24301]